MISSSIQIDLDLWEAWIEFDHLAPKGFGSLYVMGEILTNKQKLKPALVKRPHPDKTILALNLHADDSGERTRLTEVVYDEHIEGLDSYTTILIFKENELIAEITDIEVLI